MERTTSTQPRTAGVITVGTELTEGLRVDTNTAEIARTLSAAGIEVLETVSVGDDGPILAATIGRLSVAVDVVLVTGGLGPTHDDITREAASEAVGRPLVRDERLAQLLAPAIARHSDPDGARQVLRQADVIEDAQVIDATTGTAPGQIVTTRRGLIALLPGPPKEMRGMLPSVLAQLGATGRAAVRELGVTGRAESDVQLAAQRVLSTRGDVRLTVLARPGDVRVLLLDRGAGPAELDQLAHSIADEIGDACYTLAGETLAQALVREAGDRSMTLAVAESCTGGMVSAAITDVAGASQVFTGGVVTYSDDAKRDLLGVQLEALGAHGAVSSPVVAQMAAGACERLRADVAVAISGIAGPEGGSAEKPVGTVWFGVAATGNGGHSTQILKQFQGDRELIRLRATTFALDLLRRYVCELPTP